MSGRRSLVLATIDPSGNPHASYAPFWRNPEGLLYIYVSNLSPHTRNLESGQASILLLEDEQDSRQIFARTRISFQCNVGEIEREGEPYHSVINALHDLHGEVIKTLETLPDFRLFELRPESGRFIRGFGQAYEIDAGLTSVVPITGP